MSSISFIHSCQPSWYSQETPVFIVPLQFPPWVTILLYFSWFMTYFHTFFPFCYHNLFLYKPYNSKSLLFPPCWRFPLCPCFYDPPGPERGTCRTAWVGRGCWWTPRLHADHAALASIQQVAIVGFEGRCGSLGGPSLPSSTMTGYSAVFQRLWASCSTPFRHLGPRAAWARENPDTDQAYSQASLATHGTLMEYQGHELKAKPN